MAIFFKNFEIWIKEEIKTIKANKEASKKEARNKIKHLEEMREMSKKFIKTANKEIEKIHKQELEEEENNE